MNWIEEICYKHGVWSDDTGKCANEIYAEIMRIIDAKCPEKEECKGMPKKNMKKIKLGEMKKIGEKGYCETTVRVVEELWCQLGRVILIIDFPKIDKIIRGEDE